MIEYFCVLSQRWMLIQKYRQLHHQHKHTWIWAVSPCNEEIHFRCEDCRLLPENIQDRERKQSRKSSDIGPMEVTVAKPARICHLFEQSCFFFGTQWLVRLTSAANSTWYIAVQFQAIHCKYGGFTRKIINLSWEIPVWLCAERCFTSIAVGLLP